jgi:hypothetical protein
MDKPSDQTIQSVWQRVQQKPQSPAPPELPPLLTGLRQEAVLYTLLLNRTNHTGLKPLLKQVNSHIASVKGMCLLSGAEIQHFVPPQPRQENWETAMRRAYNNALGRLTEYEKRTSDASFGPVFSILAEETKSALRTITTLCGSK